MPVEIVCPNCTRKYLVSEQHIGRKVVCADTACGTRFVATVKQVQLEETIVEEFFEAVDKPADLERGESFNPVRATVQTELSHDQVEYDSPSPRDDETIAPSPQLSEASQADMQDTGVEESKTDLTLDTTERGQKQFWGMAKKVLGDASARVSIAGIAATSKAASIGSSGVAKAAEVGKQSFNAANSALDSSGVKDAVKATASVVSGKLDEVSGKRLVELLEKKLQIQDSYNDILATRLAEALDRITVLEDRFNKLASHSSETEISAAETQR